MKLFRNSIFIAACILAITIGVGVYWTVRTEPEKKILVVPPLMPVRPDTVRLNASPMPVVPRGADSTGTSAPETALFEKMMKLEERLITHARNYGELVVVVDNMRKESRNFRFIPGIIPLRPGTYRRISSHFGMRFHPIRKVNKMHYGMDVSAVIGTPVYATADGVVAISSYHMAGYGTMVQLRHPFGFGTIYGHLKSFTCRPGQAIRRGELIGYVGSTGLSTGPHLHYEIVKNGQRIDPIEFVQFARKIFLNDYD